MKANALDLMYVSGPEEWENKNLSRPEGSQQSDSSGELYPMPTIGDIATRLHGAKVFSVLDAKNGFWHVKLDEKSSFLTTLHSRPFAATVGVGCLLV